MFTARTARMAAAGLAASALLLTGCSSTDQAKDTTPSSDKTTSAVASQSSTSATTSAATSSAASSSESTEEKITDSDKKASLSDWDGSWKSLHAYLDDADMKPHMEEAAKEHNESVDEIKAEIEKKRGADFSGMVIGDDKITFVTSASELDSTDASKGIEYKFVGAKDVSGKHEYTWFIYEAASGDPEHKYLLMMPLHGEETLAHFHMRYGKTIDEALNSPNGWFPTFVNPKESTTEQVAETLFHHHH